MTDYMAKRALLRFMGSRCNVSSQHKLPTLDEILSTVTAEFIGVNRVKRMVSAMLLDSRLIAYGPYLSDHEIDAL
jgi:hypothetical protein